MKLNTLVLITLTFFFNQFVYSETKKVSLKNKSALSTDVKFDDQSVSGKYQVPFEALSVVENEKPIDDLIGVRKNFQDRIKRSKGLR